MNWILKEEGFAPDKIVTLGNRFLIGNGYLGYRGTLDEYTSSECVGLNVAGVYDGVPGKWRETINAFNPFYLSLRSDGEVLDVHSENLRSHEILLDLSCGEFSRKTVFVQDGAEITLYSERFVSMADDHTLCSRTIVKSSRDICVSLKVGVDSSVWELNGPHFRRVERSAQANVLSVRAYTQEEKIPVSVYCAYSVPFTHVGDGFAEISVKLSKDVPFVLDRTASVFCGEKGRSPSDDYEQLRQENREAWKKLWQRADVQLEGDEKAQFALRYSIYHLLILMPRGEYSIAARGLSGQTYKGAVFWDTEIFMLPFFLTVFPERAENLIKYRINTLPAARGKAKTYGYSGAFYAWESQDGYDACSDFNVVDVFTHRPVRTYFKDKQIHISADVSYAIVEYYRRTGDDGLMLEGGLETLLECARFLYSYSYFNHIEGRYELLDVIGPDEYHERVNNNAYTNYMAHYTAKNAVLYAEQLREEYPEKVEAVLRKLPKDTLETLKVWAEKLYLPQPNENGVIEQFDGYFQLEDVGVEKVRSRLVKPNEYWGGSGGVATATRVIKQADVIMLFNLLPDLFGKEIQRANYRFYLPYTEHGSSLSHCSYALTACRIGEREGCWDGFLRSAEIDLKGGGKQWAGEIYIGGTHPAASGGAWLAAVYGFAGLTLRGSQIRFSPMLPDEIKAMTFTVAKNDGCYKVFIEDDRVKEEKIS